MKHFTLVALLAIAFFFILRLSFIGNITYAGIFDQLNPSVLGARKAAEDIKEESKSLGQPYGLFGTYWGMLEQDFLKEFKHCTKVQGEKSTYKEYRNIENTKVSVVYIFTQLQKTNISTLVQIVVVPVIDYKTTDDINNTYTLFRDYIINNISPLSEIEYKQDRDGNITEITSSANFKYSKLVHSITLQQGRALHVIYFFKKKR